MESALSSFISTEKVENFKADQLLRIPASQVPESPCSGYLRQVPASLAAPGPQLLLGSVFKAR